MRRAISALGAFGAILLTGVASATIWHIKTEQVWYIKRSTEPSNLTAGHGFISMKPIGFCEGQSCPHHGEEGVIDTATAYTSSGAVISNWNYVKCMAFYDEASDTNEYFWVFYADDGQWPSSWPHKVMCDRTENGNTIDSEIVLGDAIDPLWSGDAPVTISLTTGYTITLDSNSAGYKEAGLHIVQTLPAGNYTDGEVQAVKDGVNWTGVKCLINERGAGTVDKITYSVGPFAAVGTGHCPINGTNSPVGVVREP